MAGYLARKSAKKTVVVEERKIGEAVISKPGVTPPPPVVPITLDTLGKAKHVVDSYATRGECVPVDRVASEAKITPGEANASLTAMKTLEYGENCCPTHFCTHKAVETMLTKIKRWRTGAF